jgi:hypothetical protein
MSGLRRFFFPVLVLGISFLPAESQVGAEEAKVTIQGVSHANLRAGPSLNYPPTAILKEGDELTVEGQEGEWYRVTTSGGQRGYVHKTVVKLVAGEPVSGAHEPRGQPPEDEVKKAPPTNTLGKAEKLPDSTTPRKTPARSVRGPAAGNQSTAAKTSVLGKEPTRPEEPKAKSRALIQLLVGRDTDVMVWVAIAIAFFCIGWICGGNYYLRRERFRRTKLRF